VPTQAVAQVSCGGFTEAQAAALGYDTFQGNANDNTYTNNTGNWVWADGGGGNDTLISNSGNDIMCGGPGNDTIETKGGFDSAYGGFGNDTIKLGDGDFDYAEGGEGNDSIYGGSGPDLAYGDDQPGAVPSAVGADFLDGGDEDDQLFGGPGSDNLLGKSGTDRLFGDEGNDILKGGNGPAGEADEGDGGTGLGDQCVQFEVGPFNCP
jgi:Ca2+-binding RTX toxin-like protein